MNEDTIFAPGFFVTGCDFVARMPARTQIVLSPGAEVLPAAGLLAATASIRLLPATVLPVMPLARPGLAGPAPTRKRGFATSLVCATGFLD